MTRLKQAINGMSTLKVGAMAAGFFLVLGVAGGTKIGETWAVPDRIATLEAQALGPRIAHLEQIVERLQRLTDYQMCRSLQIDSGRDPSGCQRAYGIDPQEFVP